MLVALNWVMLLLAIFTATSLFAGTGVGVWVY